MYHMEKNELYDHRAFRSIENMGLLLKTNGLMDRKYGVTFEN